MKRRHRAGLDLAEEPRTHDQIVALTHLLDEPRALLEVVREVGVAHDHDLASGGLEAGHQGAAVSALGHRDDACSTAFRDLLRAVIAAVVGNDHFSFVPVVRDALLRRENTPLERLCFVQTRKDETHVQLAPDPIRRCGHSMYPMALS